MDLKYSPKTPSYFELGGDFISPDVATGQRSWCIRSQNLGVIVSWLGEGEKLREEPTSDEHAILVLGEAALEIEVAGATRTAEGPCLAIVPAGEASAVAKRPGWVVRLFTARAGAVASRAFNAERYKQPDKWITALPDSPAAESGTLRIHPLESSAASDPSGHQTFRTDSLMIQSFIGWTGGDETDHLESRLDRDQERVSITIDGEYVHHVRRPWQPNLETWGDDEHVQCTSPSVTVIPPGNRTITRAVGEGPHTRIDVYAPGKLDLSDEGPIANESDYAKEA